MLGISTQPLTTSGLGPHFHGLCCMLDSSTTQAAPSPQAPCLLQAEGAPVLRPARTSIRVVLPAPELPTRAVRMPGRKMPEQSLSSCSMVVPSTSAALGPCFSGSVVSMACISTGVSTAAGDVVACWLKARALPRCAATEGLHAQAEHARLLRAQAVSRSTHGRAGICAAVENSAFA